MSEYKEIVDTYVEGVLDNTIPAGRLVKLAVRRHLEDLAHGKKRGLYFAEDIATESCEFFPAVLRHSKGEWAGRPFHLTPSQAFITWSLFGWRREEDGCRRFTRALIEVGRKYGKSEFASGLALKVGTFDQPFEPAAEVYLCATKEDQVRDTTFRQCTRMIKASPSLSARVRVLTKSLVVHDYDEYQPNSIIKPIGSDSETSDGFDLSSGVLDELHAWRKHHLGFYERMTTAGGSRRQELVMFFTTAGDDHSELWISIREKNVRVLESVETGRIVSDHEFAFIACIDEGDDPLGSDVNEDEFIRIMSKANPNYPLTPKKKYLLERATEARDNPIERNKFLRFHANIRVSASIKPFPIGKWKELSVDTAFPVNGVVGAFDLGRSDDFAAWSLVGADEYGRIRIRSRSYTCEDRRKQLVTPEVTGWIKSGELIVHPGDEVDFDAIMADMLEAHEEYGVTLWGFDPQFAKVTAQQMRNQLGEEVVLKFGQSYANYNESCRRFLKEFKGRRVAPDRNDCLAWQARNVSFKSDAKECWMPEKGIGQEYKIDAMVATLMAYSFLILNENEVSDLETFGIEL